jgi:hypothetical protein
MGYRGCMGYGMHFSANRLGGPKNVWGIREYGLSELWVMRESTVVPKNHIKSCARPNQVNAVRTVVIVAVTKAWPYI